MVAQTQRAKFLLAAEDVKNCFSVVTPVKTGVQKFLKRLDSGFRRNDGPLLQALFGFGACFPARATRKGG